MTPRSSKKRTRAAVSRRPLVVCVGGDADTRHLSLLLEEAGAETLLLDPGGELGGLSLRVGAGPAGGEVEVLWQGRALHHAAALVLRQLPGPPTLPDPEAVGRSALDALADRWSAARERAALLRSALLLLCEGRRLVLHPPADVELHLHKPLALARLAAAGVQVPESLAGADAVAARTFWGELRDAGAELVYKPVAGGAVARRFVDDDAARLHSLRHAPVLFQRRVRAQDDLEHRVYLLDGAPLACFALPTAGVTDARLRLAEARRVPCPRAVALEAARAARALGLCFCAVDARLEPAGTRRARAVVLDVNPAPSLLDWPDGGAVARALARFIVRKSRGR